MRCACTFTYIIGEGKENQPTVYHFAYEEYIVVLYYVEISQFRGTIIFCLGDFLKLTAHQALVIKYFICTVLTVRFAAPRTALWAVNGSRFEPGTDDL